MAYITITSAAALGDDLRHSTAILMTNRKNIFLSIVTPFEYCRPIPVLYPRKTLDGIKERNVTAEAKKGIELLTVFATGVKDYPGEGSKEELADPVR